MDVSEDPLELKDNGGTRTGVDRRQAAKNDYTPERRKGQDRRSGIDRRNGQKYRGKQAVDRREVFKKTRLPDKAGSHTEGN